MTVATAAATVAAALATVDMTAAAAAATTAAAVATVVVAMVAAVAAAMSAVVVAGMTVAPVATLTATVHAIRLRLPDTLAYAGTVPAAATTVVAKGSPPRPQAITLQPAQWFIIFKQTQAIGVCYLVAGIYLDHREFVRHV